MKRWLVAIAVVAGCQPDATNPVAPRIAIDRTVLNELALLATANAPPAAVLDQWAGSIQRGEQTVEQYIDMLLDQPAFGRVIAPEILMGETLERPTLNINRFDYYKLKITPSTEHAPVVYLTKPCAATEAVEVEPWWALGTKIKVCPAAYNPDVWEFTGADKEVRACDAMEAAPTFTASSPCGCGPNLIRCWLDPALENLRKVEAHDELRETVAYVVQHELPVQDIYRGTSTFRRPAIEGVYRWYQIEAEHRTDAAALLRDLATWPETGKWAERRELAVGQHAGLLTTPANLYQVPDKRQRQWRLFDLLWCSGVASQGVTTDDLLSLQGGHSFQQRNDGWQQLAQRPICTNCHARMDYGFQFFNGYPSPISRAGHFVPEMQDTAKTGPLFLENKDDLRGQAALTPAAFSALAMSQPEFSSCIASKFVRHVYGVGSTAEDVHAIEAQTFNANKPVTIKALAKATLLRWVQHHQASEVTAANSGTGLHAQLEELCSDCHHAKADIPDLEAAKLSRPLMLRSLAYLSAEMMPKNQPIPIEQRLELIHLLVDQLWAGAEQRREAYDAASAQLLRPGAHRWTTIQRSIDERVGIPITPWNATEGATRADQASLTPNIAVMSTLEAIRACKLAGNKAKALADCVERATPTTLISR